jgi:hypothetical protein
MEAAHGLKGADAEAAPTKGEEGGMVEGEGGEGNNGQGPRWEGVYNMRRSGYFIYGTTISDIEPLKCS